MVGVVAAILCGNYLDDVTGWAAALTCCITLTANYMENAALTPRGAETPE